jgi:hypothetical protein
LGTTYGGTGQDFGSTAQGNVLYFSAAGTLSALGPGTAAQALKTNGAGANPSWNWPLVETAEAATTPVADNTTLTPGTGVRLYAHFTMPSTEKFYIVTGIEWKNGGTVAGNILSGVDLINANPTTQAATVNLAVGQELAQAGANVIQRQSMIASRPIRGGTLCTAWIVTSNASSIFRILNGQANQAQQKSIAYAVAVGQQENTAWTNSTNRAYIKVYYVGYK